MKKFREEKERHLQNIAKNIIYLINKSQGEGQSDQVIYLLSAYIEVFNVVLFFYTYSHLWEEEKQKDNFEL